MRLSAFKQFPDTLVIISAILVIFMVLTWIIPAGEFDRQTIILNEQEKEVVVEGSYHEVDQQPQDPWDLLIAPLKGFEAAAYIIGFVFFVGGAFTIINRTGAINAGLMSVVRFSKQHPQFRHGIIPLLMVLFSLAGSTFGMAEETLVFVMITIPLAYSMGYDALVGVAIPFVGAGAGFAGAFANPFTIGIAQGIAGIEIFSGMPYRLLVWSIYTAITIAFVMWYALRIEKNPSKSLMAGISQKQFSDTVEGEQTLTTRRVLVLAILGLGIAMLIVGATVYGWYIHEISALFIILGITAAVVYGLSTEETVNAFYQGCKDVLVAAIIIGFARALLVIAEDGKIIDTIMHNISQSAEGLPDYLSVQIMFIMQSVINFFIPSGSGQAALTMPIMAPLSDLLGFSRQTAVLAYQFGDGISNMIVPTSGLLMGILSIAGIPYDKWFRFIIPLIILLSVISMLLLLPPVLLFQW